MRLASMFSGEDEKVISILIFEKPGLVILKAATACLPLRCKIVPPSIFSCSIVTPKSLSLYFCLI